MLAHAPRTYLRMCVCVYVCVCLSENLCPHLFAHFFLTFDYGLPFLSLPYPFYLMLPLSPLMMTKIIPNIL